jgi:hypothetical protein
MIFMVLIIEPSEAVIISEQHATRTPLSICAEFDTLACIP